MRSATIIILLIPLLVCISANFDDFQKAVGKSATGLNKPSYHDDDDQSTCTMIREPVCQGLQYNETRMPNWVKMTSQDEAAKRMIDYRSLLNVKCSHYLKLFLCTIYFPMCARVLERSALKPCKPLCVHVRNRCEPIMQRFQFNWPAELACEDLPESPSLCIEPDGYGLDSKKPILTSIALDTGNEGGALAGSNSNLNSLQRMYPQLEEIFRQRNQGSRNLDTLLQAAFAAAAAEKSGLQNGVVTRSCTGAEFSFKHFSNGTCLSHCGADLFYRAADKKFARTWLLVWSCLCLFSSGLTFLTFLADTSRLQYPERPVLYLAACYFAVAVGHILQYCLGPERVACRSLRLEEGDAPESYKYLLKSGQEGTWCTVGFLILYYFGMASNFWWVMLSLAWYLSTSRKWGHEGVESVSSVFHMFAWALPAIQAILILILHKIDADELTGTCYTGYHSETTLLFGVLLPQAACLITGLILLSIGFAAVFQVRKKLKIPSRTSADRERDSRRRLEKSIAKLGVFAVLYTFPMACLLAGNIYEYLGQPKWRAALDALHHSQPQCLSPRGAAWGINDCHPPISPSSEAAMLRIFMSLVVGITSGMWVWANKKTFNSWRNLLCRHRSSGFGKFEGDIRPHPAYRGPVGHPASAGTAGPVPAPSEVPSERDRLRSAISDSSHPPQQIFMTDGGTGYSNASGYQPPGCQSCHTRDNLCPSELTAGYSSSQSAEMYPMNMDGLSDCYMPGNNPMLRPDYCNGNAGFHPGNYPGFLNGGLHPPPPTQQQPQSQSQQHHLHSLAMQYSRPNGGDSACL